MKSFRCAVLLAMIGLPCGAALLNACTAATDRPPPAANAPYQGPGPTGGGVDGGEGGATGADTGPGSGGGCNTLTASPTVTDVEIATAIPPATGGNVGTGTFRLIEHNMYTGDGGRSGPTGGITTYTLSLDGTKYEAVTASGSAEAGLGTEVRAAGIYTFMNTTFDRIGNCGSDQIPVSYSSDGTILRLSYFDDEYVYRKQ